MQPNNQQQDITPEEAFSSLGLATRLNEQLLMQQHPQEELSVEGEGEETPTETTTEAPQEPQDAPEQEQDGKDIDNELKGLEKRLTQKIEEIDVSSELEDIKKELNSLKEDDTTE